MFFIIENQEDLLKTERLYEKYKSVMLHVAYNILKDTTLSEDAVHTSFVRIIDNLHKIEESDHVKTKNFLYIICRNVSYDTYNARLDTIELCGDMEFEDDHPEPSEIIINHENLKYISEAIGQLNQIYQDVIYLKFFHGFNTSEIAQLLHVSDEVVKKRIQRGKVYLLKKLEIKK